MDPALVAASGSLYNTYKETSESHSLDETTDWTQTTSSPGHSTATSGSSFRNWSYAPPLTTTTTGNPPTAPPTPVILIEPDAADYDILVNDLVALAAQVQLTPS